MNIIERKNVDTEELDNKLEEDDYYDIPTLVDEIIENKPDRKYSLRFFWNKNENFFKKQTLCLTKPIENGDLSYNGPIFKCKKNNR